MRTRISELNRGHSKGSLIEVAVIIIISIVWADRRLSDPKGVSLGTRMP